MIDTDMPAFYYNLHTLSIAGQLGPHGAFDYEQTLTHSQIVHLLRDDLHFNHHLVTGCGSHDLHLNFLVNVLKDKDLPWDVDAKIY